MQIKIEVSARHLHLTAKHFEKLFGKGKKLTKLKSLSQGEQFSAKETLAVKSGKNIIPHVRIVGPFREQTQIEISQTDAWAILKTDIPLCCSGKIEKSAGCVLIGPKGKIKLKKGLITVKRHIHFSVSTARKLNLKNGDLVKAQVLGERGLIFENIVVRIKDQWKNILHLDTDEGNSAGIRKRGRGQLIV